MCRETGHVMPRDMRIGCFETSLFFELAALGNSTFCVSGSGSRFRAAGLAFFVGIDGECCMYGVRSSVGSVIDEFLEQGHDALNYCW